VEAATSADAQEHVNVHLNSLGNMIRSSLSCSPADPFLWLVLYWVESTENGSKPDYLKYLRMSYRLGPNEGWIELKRNHIAFAIFEQLPLDLAENTIDEFVALLEMGQYEQIVKTFTSQTWRVRYLLLLRLKNVADQYRRAFSNALYSRGYDVDVPGIKRPDPRPWD
jgi:hypothetical protein